MMPKSATCGTSFNVRVWCNTDPCGLICAVISWLLVLYAESIVVGVVLYPWLKFSLLGLLNTACFTSIAFLALSIIFRVAMLTDPGAVPEHAIPAPMSITTKEEQDRYQAATSCVI
ncbi:hypothetical protein ABG067_002541 [Albugo candida]